MNKLALKFGKIFLAIDVAFWAVVLAITLVSPDHAAESLTFLPVFWYAPISILMTSISLPFLAKASMTTTLLILALLGSFQHFVFGYVLGWVVSKLKGLRV